MNLSGFTRILDVGGDMTLTVAFIWLGFMSFTLAMCKRTLPAFVYGLLWVGCVVWSVWAGWSF